jgi:hypothetical protein
MYIQISKQKIWDDLLSAPMITITKEEDAKLRAIDKAHSKLDVEYKRIRYHLAKIEIV